MGVVEGAGMGRLPGLLALREALASEIDAGPGEKGSQTAALARQLRDVLREIEEIEKASPKGSLVDDLRAHKKRKSAGRAASSGADAAGGVV